MHDSDASSPVQSDFAHVDDAAQPLGYAAFLERMQRAPVIRWLKAQSYTALEVRAGMQILEVGCGLGDDARALAQQVGTEGKVVGLDNSQNLLTLAQQRTDDSMHNITFHFGDMHHVPFADATFDGCRAERVLLHSPAPTTALAEMIRVLKPGGHIALVEPDLDTHIIALDDLALARKWTRYYSDATANGTIGRHLPGMLQQMGLREIQVISAVHHAQQIDLTYFGKQIQRALAKGQLTASDGQDLRDEVRRRLEQQTYFQYTTFFLVAAQKPEAQA